MRAPDLAALREYRLERLRGELRRNDCAGLLVFDPLNIRYATDTTNMQVWIAHNPTRACFIATDGPVVLFEYGQAMHLAGHLPLVDEVRPVTPFFYFLTADRTESRAPGSAARGGRPTSSASCTRSPASTSQRISICCARASGLRS